MGTGSISLDEAEEEGACSLWEKSSTPIIEDQGRCEYVQER